MRSRIAINSAMVAAAMLAARAMPAQPPEHPAFDAASVKPGNAQASGRMAPGGGSLQIRLGKVSGRNVTARRMILDAYHIPQYQLAGGPGWLDSDRFDIDAKAGSPVDDGQLRQMLQTLLADRFKLIIHHAEKEMAVYALTVGKNGAKLIEWKEGQQNHLSPPPGPEGAKAVGNLYDRGPIQNFIDTMNREPSIGRPVIDKTGLQGNYVFFVTFYSGQDFIASVEEELGLRFQPQKAMMPTVVIDRIEKPEGN